MSEITKDHIHPIFVDLIEDVVQNYIKNNLNITAMKIIEYDYKVGAHVDKTRVYVTCGGVLITDYTA